MAAPLRWQWARFADLGVDGLYDALQLRCRVFVL
ncbi:MAG: GNAT family N-acetyltransferase, partial [Burkholderiaceae bacterium]